MLDNHIQDLQKDIHQVDKHVVQLEERIGNLHTMVEKHIETHAESDAILQALSQSMLQDQTRTEVESQHAEKESDKQDKWDNKRLVLWTTAIVAISAILTNPDKIIGVIQKILSVFNP